MLPCTMESLTFCVVALYTRCFFFFSSRRRHTRWPRDWSSDVCSSDLVLRGRLGREVGLRLREGILCLRPAEGLARLRVGVLGLGRGLRPRVRGVLSLDRSEERRVGKECRWGRSQSE